MVSIALVKPKSTGQDSGKKRGYSAKRNKNLLADQVDKEEKDVMGQQVIVEIAGIENTHPDELSATRVIYGKTTFQQDMTPILRKGGIFDFMF